jgi:Flp pilus assembly protein TadB
MEKNMGGIDRLVRLVIAAVLAVLVFAGIVTGILAWILAVLAAIFFLTSLFGCCLLYLPFRVSTRRRKKEQA